MVALLRLVLAVLASSFKSKCRLEAENVALRHQLIVLRRKVRSRPRLTNNDRWFFIQLYRWFPSILQVLTIIRPETLVRWHRAGFRCYWRWKSRSLGGRPQIETDLRMLIRRMSVENPLWGAPRIHGELVPSENHIRTYWWCSPAKIGMATMAPERWTARCRGASFCNAKCVRT